MVWPFKKRRKDAATRQPLPPLSEKAQPQSTPPPARTTLSSPPRPTSPALPRRSSKRAGGSQRKRHSGGTQQHRVMTPPPPPPPPPQHESPAKTSRLMVGQEKHEPRRQGSVEDITALPVSRKLSSSPHLRAVDAERTHMPYNFRPYSTSQTSLQRIDAKSSRPQTLRSRRSGYDSVSPTRRRSSKRRKDDHVREEEIRSMTAAIPIPKRPGEGPLRRDSKKLRSLGVKGSNVSLPPEESIHSTMSGIIEQRGWEVGSLDIFSPRPAVRLSGTPQYVGPGSLPGSSYTQEPRRDKLKQPATRDLTKKRQTIGEEADDFDASDLRLLMERDAKRRERRKQEQQEKLERKLRSREGRNRGDSDKRKRDAEEQRRAMEARQLADVELQQRALRTPPPDVHPALRNRPPIAAAEDIGFGIGANPGGVILDPDHAETTALQTTEDRGTTNTGTYLNYPPRGAIPENPFVDPLPSSPAAETEPDKHLSMPGAFTPMETPMEGPILHTAQTVRMSRASTPPLSPVRTGQSDRARSGQIQAELSDLPPPPPIPIEERRASDPTSRRAGAWAAFFRRSGTASRKSGSEAVRSPSEFSFSNTSRESMRNQPLPAHLVDTQSAPKPHRRSGTPARTQSKFREDLPEMPMSPPDSRMPSPDVTTMAAAAAAARRGKRSKLPIEDSSGSVRDSDPDPSAIGRNDTPMSPSVRGHGLMSASLASMDSEGSWLASTKRQSSQSALSRGMGSLSRRNQDFAASYEELGGDKDVEYVAHTTPGPTSGNYRVSSPNAAAGAAADEDSEYSGIASSDAPVVPVTVHRSVRRQPTLVRGDPRVKSREGLLNEYSAELETAAADRDEGDDPSESQVRSARSIDYGRGYTRGHARQMSAGSAKLLDIPARPSMDAGRASPASPVRRPGDS